MLLRALSCLFLLACCPSVTVAQGLSLSAASVSLPPPVKNTTVVSSASSLPFDSLLQVVLALAVVIAFIFLLAWALRRMQTGVGLASRDMKVVAMLPLSPRERVVLVQVGEQQVLLGVAPGRVSLLQNYPQPVVEPSVGPGGEFAARLKQALKKGGAAS